MQLFLGVVPGIFPWLEEHIIHKHMMRIEAGIIFSYWSFRKEIPKIISKGLHDYFSFDGRIIVDSGAYSAFNSGVKIHIDDYLSFLSNIAMKDIDIIVNLDVIRDPKKSQQNWKYLTKKFDSRIMPVVHLAEKRNLYRSEDYIGLGGMVPAFKINQEGSVYDVASWLVLLSLTQRKRFHGFGIGSPFHQIVFQDFFFSVDWIGWRRNAAVCSCYTPEGSTFILEARKKKKKGKLMTLELFERYKPPFVDSYDQLYRPGIEGWTYRALWNVWWFLLAEDNRKVIETSKYVLSLKKRIERTRAELKPIN
ncbi:MAG: hypothetical protein ACFFAE_07825 [Candidatus Hodarchaeota archaeon]